jgi:hypothetical protein
VALPAELQHDLGQRCAVVLRSTSWPVPSVLSGQNKLLNAWTRSGQRSSSGTSIWSRAPRSAQFWLNGDCFLHRLPVLRDGLNIPRLSSHQPADGRDTAFSSYASAIPGSGASMPRAVASAIR